MARALGRQIAGRAPVVQRLEEHPNLSAVLGVLAQLAHISDDDLPRLAEGWVNSPSIAQARDRALSPDSPLVVEVLAAFDAVSALFADDLLGEACLLAGIQPVPEARRSEGERLREEVELTSRGWNW